MKFSNGCWLNKDGIDIYGCAQLYYSSVDGNKLNLYCPTRFINHRGDTLGGPTINVSISSPFENTVRIQAYHFKGVVKRQPEPKLNISNDAKVDITETDEVINYKTGTLTVQIQKKGNFKIRFIDDEKGLLTESNFRNIAYVVDKNTGKQYMREQLNVSVGECIYGLGERFTPFVKNGQTVDIWNEDGGTSTEQSYKNIPFYVTNKGYGVYVNNLDKVSFEIASEKVSKVQFSVPGESIDYFFFNGNGGEVSKIKNVLMKYTDLTGKPALPPDWSFGLWLTTSFTTNYDEETVTSFVDGFAERNLPLDVFHFDCFWMKGFHWCDFEWDSDVFPNPKEMLERLHKKNLKICVWINPYIAQESSLFDEGVEKGYFIKRTNGDTWQWDMWQPGMAIVDFTNPDACKWYADKLNALLDMGVDCFKTDFGERIPTEDVMYYDGSDVNKMHNYYTYLYNKVVFEVLENRFGKDQAILYARSATVGSQSFPIHWGGDCDATYESMAESLRGGLSLSLSGFGFWSSDIGGFESTAPADIYKRWIAFGLLSTHSRLHGSTSYRVPWLYDEESVDVMRFFTNLKKSITPYLLEQARKTSQTGIPMMRAMMLEFPEDPNCTYIDRQYMLGDSIMVAPIFNEEGTVTYYLPEGEWANMITGERRTGGKWFTEKHDYFSLPLYTNDFELLKQVKIQK